MLMCVLKSLEIISALITFWSQPRYWKCWCYVLSFWSDKFRHWKENTLLSDNPALPRPVKRYYQYIPRIQIRRRRRRRRRRSSDLFFSCRGKRRVGSMGSSTKQSLQSVNYDSAVHTFTTMSLKPGCTYLLINFSVTEAWVGSNHISTRWTWTGMRMPERIADQVQMVAWCQWILPFISHHG